MPGVELSVVLPAYLEEENLRLLLPRLLAVLKSLAVPSEILVIDTVAPMDNSRLVCEEFGARYVNRGPTNDFGDAMRTGIREARGERLLFMDADGSHTPEFIPKLYAHAKDYDVVIASRYVEGGQTENSQALIWMSRALNFTYSWVLGLKCNDVSNSFKIYPAELLKSTPLRCRNFDVIEEILFKLNRRKPGLTLKEVPFVFKKRMFGETKRNLVAFIATYLYTLLKLRFSRDG